MRDGCCCCIKLGDNYSESSCGKRNLLQEFMDKYVGRAILSLPGKVGVPSLEACKELLFTVRTIKKYILFLTISHSAKY